MVVEGIDEFEDFAESMRNITGDSRKDGIKKAKRDALKATADDFITALTRRIRASETSKGGTLDSRTSPYDPGGTNESSDDNLHISNKNAWSKILVGNDQIAVFPKPEVQKRASWLEHGTASHGPSGDTPMYFHVGGSTIVVADPPEKGDEDYKNWTSAMFSDNTDRTSSLFSYGEPGEVDGVEPQRFFEGAIDDVQRGNRFKENMGEEIDKLFIEEGLELEGAWL